MRRFTVHSKTMSAHDGNLLQFCVVYRILCHIKVHFINIEMLRFYVNIISKYIKIIASKMYRA